MSRMTCAAAAAILLAPVQALFAQGLTQPIHSHLGYAGAAAPRPGGVDWHSYLPAYMAAAPCATHRGCFEPPVGDRDPQYADGGALDGHVEVVHRAGVSPSCADGPYGACDIEPSYGASACAAPCFVPRPVYWNASAGALLLTRVAQDSYTFSYDSANENVQFVDAADADMDFSPGVEVSLGRYDFCKCVGWQATYWQLLPEEQMTQYLGSALSPGSLDGIRNYDQLDYSGGGVGDGPTAADNVNAAQLHRLTRDWEVYNIEANRVVLFGQPCGCSPWQFQSLCGFRFFKFKESLLFASDPSETMIDGDADEYRIDVRTDNQLYGLQLGGVSERCLSRRWSLRLLAKAGVYGNHAELDYFEGGTAGAAVINNGPNAGQTMRVHASDDDLAFLGEFGAGVTCRLGCRWRLGADYRILGATGLALPTDQIYFDTRGINDVRVLDNDGSLLLHGAFVRLEYCF